MRLIDADALYEKFQEDEKATMAGYGGSSWRYLLDAAPTIRCEPMNEHEAKFYDKFVTLLIQQDKENGR